MSLPPCSRCGGHEPKDMGEQFGNPSDENYSLLFAEVQLTNGILAWLCCDCRTAWLAANNANPTRLAQNRLRFKLETEGDFVCRNAEYCESGEAGRKKEVEKLAVLWDEIMALEPDIDRFARNFLSSRASEF